VPDILRQAVLSEDRVYRYRLERTWAEGARATFVMLNPSTADEDSDDPTLRRCMDFARRWGLAGIAVVNLYALRATDPAELWRATDPVGPENDRYLAEAAASGEALIAAWGARARDTRVREVLAIPGFERLTCLRTTKRGHPGHPLYLPRTLTPVPWAGLGVPGEEVSGHCI